MGGRGCVARGGGYERGRHGWVGVRHGWVGVRPCVGQWRGAMAWCGGAGYGVAWRGGAGGRATHEPHESVLHITVLDILARRDAIRYVQMDLKRDGTAVGAGAGTGVRSAERRGQRGRYRRVHAGPRVEWGGGLGGGGRGSPAVTKAARTPSRARAIVAGGGRRAAGGGRQGRCGRCPAAHAAVRTQSADRPRSSAG